jgi:hypothetical protein
MDRRGLADVSAAVVAFVVAGVGIGVFAGDSHVLAPTSTTSVTKRAVGHSSATHKKTTVVTRTRGKPPTRTTTRERVPGTPRQPRTTTVTTQTGERTFVERVLGDAGLVVLQIGVVALAAFLSAAMVQRVIVGQFGGLELGTFKLSEIASASTSGIEALGEELKKLREEAATASDLKALDELRRNDLAALKEDLALAYKRMDLIEKRLPD